MSKPNPKYIKWAEFTDSDTEDICRSFQTDDCPMGSCPCPDYEPKRGDN